MYKSRVETFNQVLYFHHLIFSLFILQDDDMKSKVQYFTCVPKQKYSGGKGKGRTVLCVCVCVAVPDPQVADPLSSGPRSSSTVCISMVPIRLVLEQKKISWREEKKPKYFATVLLE